MVKVVMPEGVIQTSDERENRCKHTCGKGRRHCTVGTRGRRVTNGIGIGGCRCTGVGNNQQYARLRGRHPASSGAISRCTRWCWNRPERGFGNGSLLVWCSVPGDAKHERERKSVGE